MVTPPAPGSGPRSGPPSGEAGYNLVVLAVAVTVLSILVAAALPVWSTLLQREKEEELIFRGWQYAEAIRVFQQRHSRPPVRIEELMEVKPRSIRQLYEDPMTESGQWDLIPVGAQTGGTELGPDGRPVPGRPPGDRPGEGGPFGDARRGEEDERQVGPFMGVKSRSDEESIKKLFGKERYDEWEFTVQALLSGQAGGPAQPGQPGAPGQPPRTGGTGQGIGPEGVARPSLPRARWIGRPFPEALQPQQGGLPGGPAQGGVPGGGSPGFPGGPGQQGGDPNGRDGRR